MTTVNRFGLLVVGVALVAACGPSVKAPPPAPAGPRADDAAMATDANAMRLQDISGMMLLYYGQRKALPGTLEDLRPLAGPDFSFSSPAMGQPYVYVRSGLAVPGQERLLVVYDAAATAGEGGGWHWGIVASLPEGNRPMTMLVVRLSEKVLEAYLQGAPAGK